MSPQVDKSHDLHLTNEDCAIEWNQEYSSCSFIFRRSAMLLHPAKQSTCTISVWKTRIVPLIESQIILMLVYLSEERHVVVLRSVGCSDNLRPMNEGCATESNRRYFSSSFMLRRCVMSSLSAVLAACTISVWPTRMLLLSRITNIAHPRLICGEIPYRCCPL